jgi:hypothetical protein
MSVSSTSNNGEYNTSLLDVNICDVVNFKRTPTGAAGAGVVDQQMVVLSNDLSWNKANSEMTATYLLDPYLIRSS